jgi:tetratricopeptide (TPR) repeat protein
MTVLGGCAQLQSVSRDAAPPTDVVDIESTVVESSRLSADGRWYEAVELVKRAKRRLGDDQRLDAHLAQLVERWGRVKRRIEDEILITNAEAARTEVRGLEALSRGQPGDVFLVSRRMLAREQLNRSLPDIIACAEWHQETNPALARRCHDLAKELVVVDADTARLEAVQARLDEHAEAEAEAVARIARQENVRRASAERADQRRARDLLSRAKAAVDAEDYRGALDTLNEVARLQPNNPEIADLRRMAEQAIDPQVRALVKLGDHLYLDEQMEAALAAWQAALLLSPEDSEIAARVDRAETVLERLELLRRQQGR